MKAITASLLVFCGSFVFAAPARAEESLEYSEATRLVQVRLAERGCAPGSADGIMGPQTQGAIRQCEEKSGLPVTGTIAGDLLKKLDLHELHQIRNVRFRAELIGGLKTADGYCQLHDGIAECRQVHDGYEVTVRLIDIVSIQDLDGDSFKDVAALFLPNFGGNAPAKLLVIALKKGGALTVVEMEDLGSQLIATYLDPSGKFIARWMEQGDADPRCCPTIPFETHFRLKNGKIVQEGIDRELTAGDMPMLIASLHSQNRVERRSAAEVLGFIGVREAVPELKRALSVPDAKFHAACLKALERIGEEVPSERKTPAAEARIAREEILQGREKFLREWEKTRLRWECDDLVTSMEADAGRRNEKRRRILASCDVFDSSGCIPELAEWNREVCKEPMIAVEEFQEQCSSLGYDPKYFELFKLFRVYQSACEKLER